MAGSKIHLHARRTLTLLLILVLAAASLAGCGGQPGTNGKPDGSDNRTQQEGRTADDGKKTDGNGKNADRVSPDMKENGGTTVLNESGQAIVPFEVVDGQAYADAEKMAGLIGFHTEYSEDGKTLMIGDHDVVMTITDRSRSIVKAERTMTLDKPAMLKDGRMLVPVEALHPLFDEEAVFTVSETQAAIFPKPPLEAPAAAEDFADDPADPAAAGQEAEEAQHAGAMPDLEAAQAAQHEAIPAIANASDLLQDAKRYLGVKYKFGAAHYSKSKRFDCSSFVQYLLAKRGIDMPRTARAQAEKGTEVSRSKLHQGDLLYFYVPGRFKTNNQVGHVGIYIGNRQMIHSSPKPQDGVQITNIDKSYWKETFLFAKRIP